VTVRALMADSDVSSGLVPPATPVQASPHAATVRAAHLAGSGEIVMLTAKARTVRDQERLEACVSCASAAAMEIRDPQAPELSAMSHYHIARVERHAADGAGRITVMDGLSVLEGAGICSQSLHNAPMTDDGLARALSSDARANALTNRLLRQGLFPGYEPIAGASRVIGIRQQLKQQRPVLLGFNLPRTYPDTFLAPGHQWDDPTVDLSSDGHCVVVIGFDDVRSALRIHDSRGSHQKFDGGCWWMGYAVADSAAILVAIGVKVRP
jgi:hypothetical protein